MAKTGMERLREAAGQTKQDNCCICVAADMVNLCDSKCNDVRGMALRSICKQIEAEHAAELKDARDARDLALRDALRKRELTDEAQGVVERLRRLNVDNPKMDMYEIVTGEKPPRATNGDLNEKITSRLIELIEHGSKQDVDVAALRKLADVLSQPSRWHMGDYEIADCIRKAIEGAQNPGADREAAADWVEAHGGLENVKEIEKDCVELQGANMALGETLVILGCDPDEVERAKSGGHCAVAESLTKRMMPGGMEWPRFEDGERVDIGDAFAWAGITHTCDAVKFGDGFSIHCDSASSSWYGYSSTDRVKRPEPEVLGADGVPIKVGETVYGTGREQDAYTVVSPRDEEPQGRFAVKCMDSSGEECMADPSMLTHTPPDTQERLDKDADSFCCNCIQYDCEHGTTSYGDIPSLLRRQRVLDAKGGE